MRAAVIVFPGSNCDRDLAVAFEATGADVTMVWHKDTTLPDGIDIVGLPGGFLLGIICAVGRLQQILRFVARSSPTPSGADMCWAFAMDFRF